MHITFLAARLLLLGPNLRTFIPRTPETDFEDTHDAIEEYIFFLAEMVSE